MRKIFLMGLLAILAIALVGCAAGDDALYKIGIPRCTDDYKSVNGKCVPRPANVRPDLFSNSQAAIDKWDKEHAAPVKKEKVALKVEDIEGSAEVAWRVDDIEGSAEAGYNNKPMMIFITNDEWCGPCIEMEKTFSNPSIVKVLNEKFVTVKYTEEHEDVKKYKVNAIPSYVFIKVNDETKTSRRIGRTMGYREPINFMNVLMQTLNEFEKPDPEPVTP